jgi:uncharacterized protein (TIGR02266 family)
MDKPITMVMPLVRIKLKCPNLDSFIDKYQADVNAVGIFVRTRSPLAAGTTIRFDFRLADDSCIFRGTGQVVWARKDETLAPLLDAGMMVSFDELYDDTRRTFEYVLARTQSFAEAAEMAPTLVRTLDPSGRPMPMTTKMSADQVEELRARMCEQMIAEGAATPPAAPAPEVPAPPAATPLAKIVPVRPRPVAVDVDVDNLRSETALVDWSRARATRGPRFIGIGLAGSLILVAYFILWLRSGLAARMIEWIAGG